MGLSPDEGGALVKLKSVEIENYRAIEKLKLSLARSLTVLHGENGYGKTSVLSAIAVGLGHEAMLGPFLDVPIDFCEEDWREGAGNPRISLISMDGITGERQGTRLRPELSRRSVVEQEKGKEKMSAYRENLKKNLVENSRAENNDMPLGVFYGTDRTVSGVPESVLSPRHLPRRVSRLDALKGALSARTDFEDLFAWFYFKEDEELREQKERRNFDYQLKELSAVRQAISSMLPEVSDPRTESNPLRFIVSVRSEQGQI